MVRSTFDPSQSRTQLEKKHSRVPVLSKDFLFLKIASELEELKSAETESEIKDKLSNFLHSFALLCKAFNFSFESIHRTSAWKFEERCDYVDNFLSRDDTVTFQEAWDAAKHIGL